MASLDILRIIVIVALVVTFFVVMKYAVRLGCLFFLAALAALLVYLWVTGNLGHIGNFFEKKGGRRAAVSLSVVFRDISGG